MWKDMQCEFLKLKVPYSFFGTVMMDGLLKCPLLVNLHGGRSATGVGGNSDYVLLLLVK